MDQIALLKDYVTKPIDELHKLHRKANFLLLSSNKDTSLVSSSSLGSPISLPRSGSSSRSNSSAVTTPYIQAIQTETVIMKILIRSEMRIRCLTR
jgi:hypothetical protein